MKRVAVGTAGFVVVAVGVALIVLPGPAILVIPLGLAILATEFPWAEKLLHALRDRLRRLKARAQEVFARNVPKGAAHE
jgi:tellurite resistance protein TerC